jgi:hypothetical protein
MWNAGIAIPAGVAGALVAGVLGTLYFTAAAAWLTTLLSWWYFRKAMRESATVPVPRWMWPPRSGGHRSTEGTEGAAGVQEHRVQAGTRAER